jgi:hypothetical protein
MYKRDSMAALIIKKIKNKIFKQSQEGEEE